MTLVSLRTFSNINDCQPAKSLPKVVGLSCIVNDLYSPLEAYTQAGGAYKIQPAERDVEKAFAILIEGGFAQAEDYEADKNSDCLTTIIQSIKKKLPWRKNP